jgi:hypothetical protein
MKAKIIQNKIFVFIFFILALSGCQKYLAEQNPSKVTTDFLYTTADGLQSAVNGLYTIERQQVSESESGNFANIMGDCGTDLDFNRAAVPDVSRYRLDIVWPTQGIVSSWWNNKYKIIERTNSIISFGEAAQIDDKVKKAILREAYLYRAYSYFWLVRKFDNIWLNTDPTSILSIDGRTYNVAKQEEVYKQIIADLDKAIEYYGTDWTVIQGRLNLGVARLLRADVALWLKDYQTAATQSTKIINEGPFALEAPENIWIKDRKRSSKEGLYVMQFNEFATGGGPVHKLPLVFMSLIGRVPGCLYTSDTGGYGWARIFPNPYLVSLYDSKNDKRFNAWWLHYYTYNDPAFDFSKLKYHFGDTLKRGDNSLLLGNNYFMYPQISCKKYWDWVKVPVTVNCYNNVYMFRYSQVLLIASEAYMRLNNNTLALSYINQIRKNRILASAPNQILTSINEDILLDEYARELAFEGQRWFLLKRMNKLVERVQKYGGIVDFRGEPCPNPLYYSCRTNIQPFHVRWPIPQSAIDAMGGFPQNPGYAQ